MPWAARSTPGAIPPLGAAGGRPGASQCHGSAVLNGRMMSPPIWRHGTISPPPRSRRVYLWVGSGFGRLNGSGGPCRRSAGTRFPRISARQSSLGMYFFASSGCDGSVALVRAAAIFGSFAFDITKSRLFGERYQSAVSAAGAMISVKRLGYEKHAYPPTATSSHRFRGAKAAGVPRS